jgi:hypothetical protein
MTFSDSETDSDLGIVPLKRKQVNSDHDVKQVDVQVKHQVKKKKRADVQVKHQVEKNQKKQVNARNEVKKKKRKKRMSEVELLNYRKWE